MQLFNTRGHKLQQFTPLHPDSIRMYSCGPTVYNHAHIGNLSSYIYADILRRTLRQCFGTTKHVMNITDVDDKTIRDSLAKYPDLPPRQALQRLTGHYQQIFLDEMRAVGNNIDDITLVKATDSIAEIQRLILRLLEQKVAYVASDGIYFSVDTYAKKRQYGQLSHIDLHSHHQERIVNDEYDKDNPSDFALWKKQKPGEPAWDFTLADGTHLAGRPGWHIECSVMSSHNLGQPFDIHTGGVDLIFPHHENEIAQSTAGDQPELYANFFVHNEHLLVDGAKMSKSAHNFFTLPDLISRGYSPLDFRVLVLQSHYRSATNFSWQSLTAARNRRHHWQEVAVLRWQVSDNPSQEQTEQIHQLVEQLASALENDLDTPGALRYLDQAYNLFSPDQTDLAALDLLIETGDQLLGIKVGETTPDIPPEDYELITQRQKAREAKDWAKSDQLRDRLADRHITINDGVTPIWSRNND